MSWRILQGDCIEQMKTLDEKSVQTCVTSPPYFGLRDYGTGKWEGGDCECDHAAPKTNRQERPRHGLDGGTATIDASEPVYKDVCGKCGAIRVDSQIGLEPTPDEFVEAIVAVFREVRRVLRDDGTVWLNLGDSYAAARGGTHQPAETLAGGKGGKTQDGDRVNRDRFDGYNPSRNAAAIGVKHKDLIGIPWLVAFALRSDGWYLRQDIIWCISGGARVYAKTQKGEMPMMVKDLVRLDPSTVQLWNGEKWTQVLGWGQSHDTEGALEIELRSGERIGCTPGHEWPTSRGLLRADEIYVGDVLDTTTLPQPDEPLAPDAIGDDVAWLVGLYLAEGSRDPRGRLQIAGHADESGARVERLKPLADRFGGSVRNYTSAEGNSANVVLDCPPLAAIVDQYVHGRSAKTKGLKPRCWRHDNAWLRSLIDGYLAGDGHHDDANDRWRIGFCRNDRLAADFRTLAARIGATITMKPTHGEGFGRRWPIYRGEIRFSRGDHHNVKQRSEVVAIRKSRARKFWDIAVADEPHLFALASGVLTHNCKPNPMPESVRDRCTKAHEYIFLLSKSQRYFFDAEAIKEPSRSADPSNPNFRANGKSDSRQKHNEYCSACDGSGDETDENGDDCHVCGGTGMSDIGGAKRAVKDTGFWMPDPTRNKRSVWTVSTKPFSGAHFATFPPDLIEPCILAGSPEKCCVECGAPHVRVVEREPMEIVPGPKAEAMREQLGDMARTQTGGTMTKPPTSRTIGFEPTCECNAETTSATVLDPFTGSGTTGMVALRHNRSFVGCELNPEYVEIARNRIVDDAPLMNQLSEAA